MIIQIGENPNNQINEADTTGIHKLYRLILADRPIVKVGAAISATTAGRIPLNIRSTIGLSLKVWKRGRWLNDNKRGQYSPQCRDNTSTDTAQLISYKD